MMAKLDVKKVKAEIESLILEYEGRRTNLDLETKQLKQGKLYELYVLSQMLLELNSRGFHFSFSGKILELKQAPGIIKSLDSHFVGYHLSSPDRFRIYTDIEVQTIGSQNCVSPDDSAFHEIDIIAVEDGVTGRPTPDDLLLGVECKSTEKFGKGIVKEALGVKREITFLQRPRPSRLAQMAGSPSPLVPSEPQIEYWLVYCDPKGNNYSQSPAFFGVEFKHWQP